MFRCRVLVGSEVVREWYAGSAREVEIAKGIARLVSEKTGLRIEVSCEEVEERE